MTSLLFDENLSHSLVRMLEDIFPQSVHPDLEKLRGATDDVLWRLAAKRGFVIVSKDDDFRQRALFYGPPPKVVWLPIGNVSTLVVATFLRQHAEIIRTFANEADTALLILQQ
jgi:predicted nuclease of predicted toxin-antitoxin system